MREAPEQVIGRVVVPGESPLWSGAPPAGILTRPTDVLLMPLSLTGPQLPGFERIENVSVVFDIIPRAKQGARAASGAMWWAVRHVHAGADPPHPGARPPAS